MFSFKLQKNKNNVLLLLINVGTTVHFSHLKIKNSDHMIFDTNILREKT